MRLVCPTCDAEYEIARTAIPRSGREVECSNCGHSWFQAFADLTIDEGLADGSHGEGGLADEAVDDEAHAVGDEDGSASPTPDLTRPLDDAVLDVLRQEAEREVKARLAETDRLSGEPQTEIALPPLRSGVEPLRASRTGQDLPPQGASSRPRRDLLPAIEEVTAALQDGPLSDAPLSEPQLPATAHPSALLRIFLLLVLAAVILLALYVFAPLIAQNLPDLAQTSAEYVAAVDRALLWGQSHLIQAWDWLQATWQHMVG
jgi:predicted Zn finger-like uncharacterized protein